MLVLTLEPLFLLFLFPLFVLGQTSDVCAQYNGNCQACLKPNSWNTSTNSSDVKSSIQFCTYCIDTNACSSLGTATCAPSFQLNYGLSNSCPVPGALPAYTTSSTGASGVFALIFIIVGPIFVFLDCMRIIFHSCQLPVVGRALRDNKMVQLHNEDGTTTTQPADAFVAVVAKGLLRVDVNSSRNKFLRPVIFFLICYIVIGMAIALGVNAFQTAPATLDMKIAMMGVARLDGDINAGILGFSNVNFLDGEARYATNCKYLSGADLRSCMIMSVVGGFSLAYAIMTFVLGSIAVTWAFRIYCQSYRLGSAYPLTFPPRFYTVVALANASLGGVMMVWGLPGLLALATGALIPHATFSTGTSWYIVMVTKVHVTYLEFFVWHMIESAWIPKVAPTINDHSPMSPSPAAPSSSLLAEHHHHLVESMGQADSKEIVVSMDEIIQSSSNNDTHINGHDVEDNSLISQPRTF